MITDFPAVSASASIAFVRSGIHRLCHFVTAALSIVGANHAAAIAPPNDHFAARITLGPALPAQSLAVEMREASREALEPEIAWGGPNFATVWWRWTAPSTAWVTAAVESAMREEAAIEAFTGGSLAFLQPVSREQGAFVSPALQTPQFVWQAIAGQEYALRVSTTGSGTASVSVQSADAPPPNDLYANRTIIPTIPYDVALTNTVATHSPDDPVSGGGTLWWQVTLPNNNPVTLEVPAGFHVRVVTGTPGAFGTVAESVQDLSGTKETLTFTAIAVGSVVRLMLAGSSMGGAATIRLAAMNTGASDMMNAATVVSGTPTETTPVLFSGNTYGATFEWSEMIWPPYGYHTVWWQWQAPATAAYEMDATNPETLLVLNYPALTVPPISRRFFRAVAGQSYLFRAALDRQEPVSFRLWKSALATNDTAAAAIVLPSAAYVEARANSAALPAAIGGMPRPTLFWKWVAPSSGQATLTHWGQSLADSLLVKRGAAFDTAVQVPTLFATSAAFQAVAGQTYWLTLSPPHAGTMGFDLDLLASATNDMRAAGISLGNADTLHIRGAAMGATVEPGEINVLNPAAGTLWWRWTAPADGRLRLNGPDNIGVYMGTASNGMMLGSGGTLGGMEVSIMVMAGATYSIQIGAPMPEAEVGFFLSLLRTAPNDLRTMATSLTDPLPLAVRGSTVASMMDSGEPMTPDGMMAMVGTWWTWTAPQTGWVLAEVDQPTFWLEVFRGGSTGALGTVGNSDVIFRNSQSNDDTLPSFCFRALAGQSYAIRTARPMMQGPEFTLRLRAVSPISPAGDDRAAPRAHDDNSTGVTLFHAEPFPSSVVQSATIEPGEPPHHPASALVPFSKSVWNSWTAPESGLYVFWIETGPNGEPHYHGVVYFDEPGTGWVRDASQIAYQGENVQFRARAGREYRFVVIGGRDAGSAWLSVEKLEGVNNDEFVDAQTLPIDSCSPANPITTPVELNQATFEALEPDWMATYRSSCGAGSLWWRWTAPQNGWVAASVYGEITPDVPLTVVAYEADMDAVDPLTTLTRANSGRQSSLTAPAGSSHAFYAVSGRDYYLAARGPWGTHQLNLAYANSYSPLLLLPGGDWESAYDLTNVINEGPDRLLRAPSEEGVEPAGGATVWLKVPPAGAPLSMRITSQCARCELSAWKENDGALIRIPMTGQPGPSRTVEGHFDNADSVAYIRLTTDTPERADLLNVNIDTITTQHDTLADALMDSGDTFRAYPAFATAEPGERDNPAIGFTGDIHSVWWKWTATQSGWCDLYCPDFQSQQSVALCRSTVAMPTASQLTSAPGAVRHGNRIRFPVSAGQVFWIGFNDPLGGTMSAYISPWTPPANDAFSQRQTITTSDDEPLDLAFHPASSFEAGETITTGISGTQWWNWTAPATEMVFFTLTDPDDPAAASLWRNWSVATGMSVSTLSYIPLVGSDDPGTLLAWGSNGAVLKAIAGTTYHLRFARLSDGRNPLRAQLRYRPFSSQPLAEPPLLQGVPAEPDLSCLAELPATTNDAYANAIPLGQRAPLTGRASVSGTTQETGEPPVLAADGSAAPGMPGTAWWNWTPPVTGWVAVRATAAPAPDDLKVLTVEAFTSGTSMLGPIASLQRVPAALTEGGAILIHAEEGKACAFRVSVAGAPLDFSRWVTLEITLPDVTAPENDSFATAVPGDWYSYDGSTWNLDGALGTYDDAHRAWTLATLEFGEPMHAPGHDQARSVWFTWTAPGPAGAEEQAYCLALEDDPSGAGPWQETDWSGPAAGGPLLAVYRGASLSTLTRIGDSNPRGRIAHFMAMPGETLHLCLASDWRAESFQVEDRAVHPYREWLLTAGGSDPGTWPNNLWRYSFTGMMPARAPSTRWRPDGVLELRWHLNAEALAAGIIEAPEQSCDLIDWQPAPIVIDPMNGDHCALIMPDVTGSRCFLRLNLELPPVQDDDWNP